MKKGGKTHKSITDNHLIILMGSTEVTLHPTFNQGPHSKFCISQWILWQKSITSIKNSIQQAEGTEKDMLWQLVFTW